MESATSIKMPLMLGTTQIAEVEIPVSYTLWDGTPISNPVGDPA